MLIYQIVHKDSGFKYIGQTTRAPIKRWREHLYPLRKGKHRNRFLQAAWNKYGESAFKFETIKEFSTLADLNMAEIELIRSGTDLYNLDAGGKGHRHTKLAKNKIGESNKKPIVGMNVKTGEVREYASASDAALEGFNQACVRKCALGYISKRKDGTTFKSISHKGWSWAPKGPGVLDILKDKCDIAKRAKVRKERPVIGMAILNEEIRQFRSASEASRHGFNHNTIRRCCIGKIKIHKGFTWVFADHTSSQSLLREKREMIRNNPPKTGPKSWQ